MQDTASVPRNPDGKPPARRPLAGTTWASDHFGVVVDAEIGNDA
jgi:hypothetical protein